MERGNWQPVNFVCNRVFRLFATKSVSYTQPDVSYNGGCIGLHGIRVNCIFATEI